MKFDWKARHVVPVERDGMYRVTLSPVGAEERKTVRPKRSRVGVAAAVEYWERVDACSDEGAVMCARTVLDSFRNGDRFLLDTEDSCRCAEVVCGVIERIDSKVDDGGSSPGDTVADLKSALLDLGSEMAMVRMSDAKLEDFDILDGFSKALRECYSVEGFASWPTKSKMAKLRNRLGNRLRGPVSFTLLGLMFGPDDYAWSPLLTQRQRRELVSLRSCFDTGSADSMSEYACLLIGKMTEIKTK